MRRTINVNKKILFSILIGASLLMNVAGIVVFIVLLHSIDRYNAITKERDTVMQNMAALKNMAVPANEIGSQQISRRTFESLVDGTEDYMAVLAPSVSGRLDNTLVVYLHGMGSNYLEPFQPRQDKAIAEALSQRFANLCVLSCSYRKESSWGSDIAMADITQNIRELMQQYPIDKIVIMGTSMGGCTALTYAATAPEDIKKKLFGIVSVEGAGDLARLYATTQYKRVRTAIADAMGGIPTSASAQYQKKSFIPNIGGLPKDTRVAIVSAAQDIVVPVELQTEIIAALESHNFKVKRIDVNIGHGAPPSAVYVQALEFALTP